MSKIKGKILSFDKVHADGIVFSKDCKINYPEKVPIIWDFKIIIQNVIGNANIIKKEDGLYFDGELLNNSDIVKVIQKESVNLGVGGFYNKVTRNNNKITSANLRYIFITSNPASSDYTFEIIESEDDKND